MLLEDEVVIVRLRNGLLNNAHLRAYFVNMHKKKKTFISVFARLLRKIFITYRMWVKIACFGTLTSVLWWHTTSKLTWPWTWFGVPSIVTVCYLATGGWRFARMVTKTVVRDARSLFILLMIRYIARRDTRLGHSISFLFERIAELTPQKVAVQHVGGRAWTFREASNYAKSLASTFSARGYQPGDVVALLMESCPEFICIWLGLTRLGVRVALINTNLRQDALVHCIRISKSRAVIFGKEFASAINDVRPQIAEMELFCQGEQNQLHSSVQELDVLIANSVGPPPPHVPINEHDVCLYIYTSGTTGFPKAAAITHTRFNYVSRAMYYMSSIKPSDIFYCCLPLYHSLAGVAGAGQMVLQGCTLVTRPKFSASQFWHDCSIYKCTVMLYIGELCRYLLAQPVSNYERSHSIRMAYGNGLRAEIWMTFKTRFNIARVVEFYGSTEGNVNLINSTDTVGAVGFNSRILPGVYPVALIRVDEVTGEPIRDKRGLCIRCNPGEAGELVGKITSADPTRHFSGYLNEKQTEKKIAYNVFSKGDKAFLSGDILLMDELGFLYFKDRTGDTFRWRGENVSTQQVEATISNMVHLKDVVVFGVPVPNNDGCAGMAVIVDSDNNIQLDDLLKQLERALPSFAIPVFVRLVQKVETTGTHKFQKAVYKKDAFNPTVTKDRLFYRNLKLKQYLPIDAEAYHDICNGAIRI